MNAITRHRCPTGSRILQRSGKPATTRAAATGLATNPHRCLRWFLALRLGFAIVASGFSSTRAAEPATPPLLSGCERDYPPFCIVHEDGRADGFAVELLRAALKTMDRDVTFRTGSWPEVRGWLERGEVQVLPLVGRTPEREALFDFTVPYLTMHGAIVVRQDTPGIRDLNDLRGRRVAVMQGDNAEEFLRREDRGLDLQTTPTFVDALRELSAGRCDAVVIQRLVALRLLAGNRFTNLRIVERPIEGFRQDFSFAVREGDRDTLALLNEGLALVVADGTHRRLHAQWFAALELPSDRPIIVGGDHNYPPFEYLDEHGRPAGFAVEMTQAIARAMGLDVRIRLGPWTEILAGFDNGEIDAIQGIFYTAERDRSMDFSPSYLTVNYISVVRRDRGRPPETIKELADHSLVVQAGDAVLEVLDRQGLRTQATTVETQEDVLRAVVEGRQDCALVVRRSALHLIQRNGWTNLALGTRSFFPGNYSYAVPLGRSALLAEFSEGLQTLKQTGEYRSIYEKWLGVYEPAPPGWRALLKHVAMVAVPLLVIALLALAWSWSLRGKVARRTAELREQQAFIHAVLDNLPVGVSVNSIGESVTFKYMNDLFPKLYRTTREALSTPGAFWSAVYEDPQFREEIHKRVEADFASGDPARMIWADVPIARRGEETTFITARNTPIPGTALTISSVWDVTERKRAEEKLAAQYRLLRVAGKTARFGGWGVDLKANKCTWSDEVAAIHEMPPGYSPTVQEGISFYGVEWRERITQVFTACAEKGIAYDEELQIVTRSGQRLWVRTTGEAVRNEQGEIVQVQGSFQDIQARKQAEAELTTQLHELQRWHDATLGREGRILELKRQVNELLEKLGLPLRYPSAAAASASIQMNQEKAGADRPPATADAASSTTRVPEEEP